MGSVESRAAARAIVEAKAKDDGPQPGDGIINFEPTPEGARDFLSMAELLAPRLNEKKPGIPGLRFWLRFPDGHDPHKLAAR